MGGINEIIDTIRLERYYNKQITGVIDIPARPPVYAGDIPFSPEIRAYLDACGIDRLYIHQAEAIELARHGKNVILVTPTASGKTLAFNIPVLEAVREHGAKALYIYPAKALSNDQLAGLDEMKKSSGIDFLAGIYDGDTESRKKTILRANADIIITNPYELHQVLPFHAKWKNFFSRLEFVVIDEAHRYKGIFGSNIAFLLRRLKRILSLYNAKPQYIAATASIANPLEFTNKLTGEPFELVFKNGAPSGSRHLVLWDSSKNPEKSVHTQTKDILLFNIKNKLQTLTFTGSRRMAELIRVWAKKETPENIASYRAGYSADLRRQTEAGLKSGEIKGVVSTNALELGIDIGRLDSVIMSGYPGSISSFWQQAGRAGRKTQDSAVFYLPYEDALQKYLLRHHEILTGGSFENAIISLDNPNILTGQILCAVSESPSRSRRVFPDIDCEKITAGLIERGLLTETPRGIIYSGGKRPQDVVSLDDMGGQNIKILVNGKILEEVELSRAYREAHKGAVHLFNGETYVIKSLNLEEGTAVAEKADPDYFTETESNEEVKILKIKKSKRYNNFTLNFGDVRVTEFYKGYKKKKYGTVLGREELNLPPLSFTTESVWFEFDSMLELSVKQAKLDFDGAIHAAEHGLIALAPLFAMCDRNDIGGRSYPVYENGEPVVFIYDGYEGGIGISEKLFDVFHDLVDETSRLISTCECENGCPNCVYSPRCGNGNSPIDKQGSLIILDGLGF
jgi:DEAD/DEAH box helicase domain-containing protein